MYYDPKSADQPKLAEGDADFEVISAKLEEATDKQTGKAYQYFDLNIKLFDSNGNQGFTRDFLSTQAVWKLKQFCDATGLIEEFNNPPMEAFVLSNRGGKCKIHYVKSNNPDYPDDKLKIKSYINQHKGNKSDMVKPQAPLQPSSTFEKFADDEIPF